VDFDPFIPSFAIPGRFAVREGTIDDLQDLLEVERLSQGAPWTERVFEKEFDLDFSHAWVVEWHEDAAPCRLAAYLVFWLVHDEVHVLNVVVHPAARRRGLARRLMDELVSAAEQQSAAMLSLEVRVGNVAAKGLYAEMGFVAVGTRPNYYADNHEDADVMVLLLDG
jgi:ribosomal-protein-alanine N-acetyltransferase